MDYRFDSVEHASLGASVYGHLREALIQGRLKPNDRLRIRELAEQFGTSVTPVRDAILRLAKEQALEMRSPRDIRVPVLDVPQYDEVYALRLELEGLAAATTVRRISASEIELLRRNVEENQRALAHGDMEAAMLLNQRFHFHLVTLTGLPLLEGFINALWMRAGPVIALAYQAFSERVAIQHHWEVLDALVAGSEAEARAAIRADIEDGYEMMAHFLATLRQR